MTLLEAWSELSAKIDRAEADVAADKRGAAIEASMLRGEMSNWYVRNGRALVEALTWADQMREDERSGMDALASSSKDRLYECLDVQEA